MGELWCVFRRMYVSRTAMLLEGEKLASFSVEQRVALGSSSLKGGEKANRGIQLSSDKKVGGLLFAGWGL